MNNNIIEINKPLVSVNWLRNNFSASNLIILDATIPKVGQNKYNLSKKSGIKKARFFDIKNVFSDKNAAFPNTVVTPEIFQKEAQKLGINKDSAIVVYDTHGIYSSPRAWWLFKAMRHDNVAVLDGGLPAWKERKFPCYKITKFKGEKGNFISNFNRFSFSNHMMVYKDVAINYRSVIDARSANRFNGLEPEPREGLRSGHIPRSKNLPYTEIIKDGKMLNKAKLSAIYKPMAHKMKRFTFTCGSGITACILALGAVKVGYSDLSIYDGSWTEWGSLTELPIEKQFL